MTEGTWKRTAEMMAERILEGAALAQSMKTATAPEERQEIRSKQNFNDDILQFLARLALGQVPTAENERRQSA